MEQVQNTNTQTSKQTNKENILENHENTRGEIVYCKID